MYKIAAITKNFPRHFDFIVSLMETGCLCGVAMVLDENNTFIKENEKLNDYYQKSEHKFFGNKFNNISRIKTHTFKEDEVNSEKFIDFVNSLSPDLTIIFDIDNLNDNTLESINNNIWKYHFGYFQNYAGINCNIYAATLNKAQTICTTLIEYKNNKYDGRIIHQTNANFRQEDTVTDAEFRSLRKMMLDMEKIINLYNNNNITYYNNTNPMIIDYHVIDKSKLQNIIENSSFLVKNLCDDEEINFIKQI